MFFGVLPDIFSFGAWMVIQLASGALPEWSPAPESLPAWVVFNYNLFHSFVIAMSAVCIVYAFNRTLAYVMLAWPFHVLVDMPLHESDYFPTKVFWPLSDFHVDGVSWCSPWIWGVNVVLLASLYYWKWRNRSKRVYEKQ